MPLGITGHVTGGFPPHLESSPSKNRCAAFTRFCNCNKRKSFSTDENTFCGRTENIFTKTFFHIHKSCDTKIRIGLVSPLNHYVLCPHPYHVFIINNQRHSPCTRYCWTHICVMTCVATLESSCVVVLRFLPCVMQPMATTWCFNCVKSIWHYKNHVNDVNHDAATIVVVIHLYK